ncbi:MAG: hypothetical protein ACKOUT_03795 [Novosphingobium sp.]
MKTSIMKKSGFVMAMVLMSCGTSFAQSSAGNASNDCSTCPLPVKLAQFTPRTGTAVKIDGPIPNLEDGDPNAIALNCCPPIFNQKMDGMFRVDQLAGKGLSDTYGLAFTPSYWLDPQMKAFAIYAGIFAPTGWTANSVLLDSEMKELAIASNATPTIANFAGGTVVTAGALRGWWSTTPSSVWNGPDGNGKPFDQKYKDGVYVSPGHMKPNTWYMIKLSLKLASTNGTPNSWKVSNINCQGGDRYVAINVRTAGFKAGPGTTAANAAVIVEIR